MKYLFILIMLSCFGCRTHHGITADSFPAEIDNQCVAARAAAINNYTHRYGSPSSIPPVMVTIVEQPPMGKGAITMRYGDGYLVQIWRGQKPFQGSLVHEFSHTLCMANGKGGSEGVVP